MKKQTAGRTNLGDFAPKFAELNDDVLFGEVWSREDRLSARDRSLVTVTALMAQGLTDISLNRPSIALFSRITRRGAFMCNSIWTASCGAIINPAWKATPLLGRTAGCPPTTSGNWKT